MSLVLYLITINLILLSRLGLTFKDDGSSAVSVLKMSAIPLFSLIFIEPNFGLLIVAAYLVLYPVLMIYTEISVENIYRNRLLLLFLHLVALATIFSPLFDVQMSAWIKNMFIESTSFGMYEMLSLQLFLLGGLLVMNEVNTALRYTFKLLNLQPIGEQNDSVSDQEYNTGRVIGVLERIFIYLFALSGQFAAIGFILTAKGIVRYKEFENRTFAEYVLIGTLLSALLALLTALLVRKIGF